MPDTLTKSEGLRERNRRETLQRITDVGMELFLANGFDATTLDEIAAAAGISRRTFFYYFKSKDDILLAHIAGYDDALKASIRDHAAAGAPIDVVRDALLDISARFQTSRTVAISRLIRDSEVLSSRRHRNDLHREQVVYETLCELWPGKDRRDRLRLVAMAASGALRIAVDAWLEQGGRRQLTKYVQEAFANLKAAI
ncbi:TetR family transcriptional regulator [Bradyrhizobium sp. CCBAU 53421]|uniref:TetR family transcriptional regulator n=1 Tax=Bradyrhizobium sp. CCBAU 53421 TaxID=1325120 RepID=UPI00188D886A|nr:TetR family transcriptional regulator [Bradyrhizobium sp. CCBAU 53421]QOZ33481.1 TetR family transcriptional regulator [Bradyrhizobium sp. CCBAU 53421]